MKDDPTCTLCGGTGQVTDPRFTISGRECTSGVAYMEVRLEEWDTLQSSLSALRAELAEVRERDGLSFALPALRQDCIVGFELHGDNGWQCTIGTQGSGCVGEFGNTPQEAYSKAWKVVAEEILDLPLPPAPETETDAKEEPKP